MSLDGWTLTSGTVDLVRSTSGTAREGQQSIDLNGTSPGSLRRTFVTAPGWAYRLDFDLSGNPIGAGVRTLKVRVNGTEVRQFEWDPVAKGNSFHLDMKWEHQVVGFEADSASTTIELTSLTLGTSGPQIDNLTFFLVEETPVSVESALILS